jgi:hypothetical protein
VSPPARQYHLIALDKISIRNFRESLVNMWIM